jgi:hypothetical protein
MCMSMYICVYVRMYVYMHVCMCVCVYVNMYVHTYLSEYTTIIPLNIINKLDFGIKIKCVFFEVGTVFNTI